MSMKRQKLDDAWLVENLGEYKTPKSLHIAYNEAHNTDIKFGTFYEYIRVSGIYNKIREPYNDEYILSNVDKYRLQIDLWKAYCKDVKEVKLDAFKAYCERSLKLSAKCWWSEEEDDYLREHFPKMGIKMLEMMNRKFGKLRTAASLDNRAQLLGLKVDKIPEGTEITDGNNPYMRVKTKDGSWVRKHRYMYEKYHGKIPEGMNIIFSDKNTNNYDIDNLVAIPNDILLILEANNMHSECSEITKTGIVWCELYKALK